MEEPNKQEGESLFNFAYPPVAEDAVAGQGGQMNLAEESDNSTIMKIFKKIQSTVIEELIKVDEEDWLYNKENLPKNRPTLSRTTGSARTSARFCGNKRLVFKSLSLTEMYCRIRNTIANQFKKNFPDLFGEKVICDFGVPKVCEGCDKYPPKTKKNRFLRHFVTINHNYTSNELEPALELTVACENISGEVNKNVTVLLRGRAIIDVYEEIRYTVLVELIKLDKLCFNRTRHDMQQFENVRQLPQST